MTTPRRRRLIPFFLMAAVAGCGPSSPLPNVRPTTRPAAEPLNVGRGLLPPAAGPITVVGDFPTAIVPADGGRRAYVLGMGYREAVYAVDTADGHRLGQVDFDNEAAHRPTSRASVAGDSPETGAEDVTKGEDRDPKTNGVYVGLAVHGGTVYAAQGGHDAIAVLTAGPDGTLSRTGSIRAAPGDFPAGLAVDAAGRLYAVDNAAGGTNPTFADPGGLTIYDPAAAGKPLGRFTFDSPHGTSNFPLAVAVCRDGSRAYVTSERDGTVTVIDTTDPAHPKLITIIATGSHPAAVLLTADESRLFVANSQSDTVSVLDPKANAVVGTVLLRPGTSRGPSNATPVNLALSPDGRTLYVPLADLNAVGVVDVPTLQMSGLIPTGRYPTAVLPTADGHLLVISARGHKAMTPNPHYDAFRRGASRDQYVMNSMPGDVQRVTVPTAEQLAVMTADVLRAAHLAPPAPLAGDGPHDPLAQIDRRAGGITHVIYIIKENRTYDQVLGDDARGNGDKAICLFGRDVTPNQHALADRFVLLDNCYACGDVSGDGWVWSTQGTANAYTDRNIPYNYSHRGRAFDFEGQNNGYITGGFPATGIDGKPLADAPGFTQGAEPIPDVAQSAPHLWDAARAAGVSYRNYGFFLSYAEHVTTRPSDDPEAADTGPTAMPDNYPTVPGLQPPGHDLAGLTDADFRQFDLDYPDSNAPGIYFAQTHDRNCLYAKTGFGKYTSPSRFAEWDREFKQMLARDPSGQSVPNLMFVRLPHDHTQGLSRRHHTPASEVADNDYAVGQLVDAVSHSAIWPHTAIFVIEDDAQAGPDHVDCHRTTAYVISPYIKRGTVDSAFANTDTLLRTMELLLGTDPLSGFDANATPLLDWTVKPDNAEPYTAVLPAKDIIAQITPTGRRTAAAVDASDKMDFAHADAAPADALNRIVWESVRGPGSVMPAPRNTLALPGVTVPHKDADGDGD